MTEDLAKIIQDAFEHESSGYSDRELEIMAKVAAQAAISAGYARRNDVMEEAATVADDLAAHQLDKKWSDAHLAAAEAIRQLKAQP